MAQEPFESMQRAIEEGMDIHSKTDILEHNFKRICVRDTDMGHDISGALMN